MCSLLVENAPAKAKAVDLEHLMSETEPATAEQREGKLDLVDPDGNSEFLSFFVGDSVFFCVNFIYRFGFVLQLTDI